MENERQDPEKKGLDRVDLNRAVRLKFHKFQDFLTEIAGNISPGGMFVRTDDPQPPGELFEFECSLADGFPLVSGRAEVVWVRRQQLSAHEPAGMGVRFVDLADNSSKLIGKIVENRLAAGEETFDLEREGEKEIGRVDQATSGGLAEEIFAATERLIETSEAPRAPAPEIEAHSTAEGELGQAAESDVESRVEARQEPEAKAIAEPVEEREAEPEPEAVQLEEIDFEPTAEQEESGAHERPPEGAKSAPGVVLPRPASAEPLAAEVPKPVAVAPAPAPAGVGSVRPSRVRLTLRRVFELVVLSVLVGGCMVLVFNQFWVRPRIESLESRLEDLSGSARVSGAPGSGRVLESSQAAGDEQSEEGELETAAKAVAEIEVPRPKPLDPEAGVAEAVQAWARAWSARRVDEYLSFYSADFVPASGATREAWESRRRDRLLSQGSIRVTVVSMAIEETASQEIRATFTQSYQSEAFRDRVRKNLRLVWEANAWRIAEELVIRQLPW